MDTIGVVLYGAHRVFHALVQWMRNSQASMHDESVHELFRGRRLRHDGSMALGQYPLTHTRRIDGGAGGGVDRCHRPP